MFGHQNEIFDPAVEEFFGLKPPVRHFGLPKFYRSAVSRRARRGRGG